MPFLSWSRGPVDLPPLPYRPDSPEGLAARWVQWVAAAGPLRNPVEDDDGRFAAENQPEDVWFLAGSYGSRLERQCAVPVGRDLFVPAFNVWFVHADGEPEVFGSARGMVTVDGVPQDLHEIATPVPFPVAGARLNGVTGRRRPVPVTVWGLWSRIPALAGGEHTVRVSGTDGFGFEVDVLYRLHVVAQPADYPVR